MIPNQWYAILESNEVKRGKPLGVTRLGEPLVAWRDARGQVTVMRDRCPHRGVALSVGDIRGNCIECPFHGFQFDTTGRGTLIPANGRQTPVPKAFQVVTYPTREAHDLIYVWYGEPRADYPPLPWFEMIDDSYSYATIRDHWTTHYSRAIENQLDVVHLPFIHRTTIGRGHRTLVHGPISKLETLPGGGERLNVWLRNEVDTGQQPLKPEDLPPPDRHPLLQFYFPNVWHNWLGDDLHIFIAFVPIDAANTLMYIRQYQRIVTTPVLREVFNIAGQIGNLIIERQDKRVVITQEPKRSQLRLGEKLIQGDGPIIEYRRRREELIGEQS